MSWKPDPEPLNPVFLAPSDVSGACFPSNRTGSVPVGHVDYGRSGPAGGARLDSNGKSTCGKVEQERKGAARTLDRYRLQRHAAKILGWPKGLSACEYARREGVERVEAWRHTSEERGSWNKFVGLQTCKRVWDCPVCSNRRAWNRRQDLQKLVEYAQKTGLTLVMLTLTSSHDLETTLKEQRRMMKKAKASLTTRAGFKKGILPRLVGSVTATEVTHGRFSGWHLHFHYILLVNLRDLPPDDRDEEAQRLGEMAWPAWEGAATNAGLHVNRKAYSVEVGEAVARYPADNEKLEGGWTLADEATRGAVKGGAGRHPFELLRLSCDEGDESAKALFQEYSRDIKGARALYWSKGLAELVGVNPDPEQQGEGDEPQEEEKDPVTRELAGDLGPKEWTGTGARPGVRARRGRMAVAVARSGGAGFELERDNGKKDPNAEGQAQALAELGLPDPDADIQLIDDDDGPVWSSRPDAETVEFLADVEELYRPVRGGLAAQALAAIRPPPPG
jgi:hypothetical protein